MSLLGFVHEGRHSIISFCTSFFTWKSTAFVDFHSDESPTAIISYLMWKKQKCSIRRGNKEKVEKDFKSSYFDIPRANEWVEAFEREFDGFQCQFLHRLAMGRERNDDVSQVAQICQKFEYFITFLPFHFQSFFGGLYLPTRWRRPFRVGMIVDEMLMWSSLLLIGVVTSTGSDTVKWLFRVGRWYL